MRIHKVAISGYRPIPFCAEYDKDNKSVTWQDNAFSLTLPTSPFSDTPMLNAIMGANSSGKSSVLFALRDFFNNPTKLDPQLFNSEQTDKPIIVEIVFRGEIPTIEAWHDTHCTRLEENVYELTIIRGWSPDKRPVDVIRMSDGTLHTIAAKDKPFVDAILPKFRIIMADPKPSEEASAKKDSLIYDLIDTMVQRNPAPASIVAKMNGLIHDFEKLVDRDDPNNKDAWEAVRNLEDSLSRGLTSITPNGSQVRLVPYRPMTTVNDIFLKGSVRINDGVELDFTHHGLGLQRSFVVSLLSTWCEKIANDSEFDYVFAIEEPEIYLHPHATRVLLNELEKIARLDQVLFTTHSSEFINRVPLEHIFIMRRCTHGSLVQSYIQQPNLSGVDKADLVKVQRYLREDRSDMLFARAVLLVEGQAEFFAMPMFARTRGFDIDQNGVSIVHVNGIDNVKIYHRILQAFNIPHVTMIDGDGDAVGQRQKYEGHADALYVLPVDFEYMLAEHLNEDRFLKIVNTCRQSKGICELDSLEITPVTADTIKKRWWDRLHDKIKQDIPEPHRATYQAQKYALQESLQALAQAVLDSGHLASDSAKRKKAERLTREGKPLAGRVAGELLTKEEIEALTIPSQVLQAVIDLAQVSQVGINAGDQAVINLAQENQVGANANGE